METHDELRAVRHQKLEMLRVQGIQPYGGKFPKTKSIQSLLTHYQDGETVTSAGRLSAKRSHGAIAFADLRDSSGKIQLCFRQDHLGTRAYQLFDLIDLGDCVGVEGRLFKTKTGEMTIEVDRFVLLAKSLRPLPEKWHGLRDVEIRYRKRYLDLIANEKVRRTFEQRSRLVESLRATLTSNGFLEVETPMMHAIPGGATGEPFVTHHKSLDADLYLRLAPELHLKQLLVGGFERIYELNRSFRNEGLSTRHNPEFTMLEAYAAYQDYTFMMDLVKELICKAAKTLLGSLQFEYQGQRIDLNGDWERVQFDLAMAELGVRPEAMADVEKIRAALARRGLRVAGLSRSQLVRLVEQVFEPKMKGKPLFVVDYWTELSPLAKSKPDNPHIAERFELFIGGLEVANAYSELNDPIEQRRRFESQLADEPPQHRAVRRIDEEFVEALEYGMPPAAGLGLGVDRLAMLLLDQPSIKDVILFPLLKSETK